MLMHQLIRDGAARRPDRVCFRWVDRDRALTFVQAAEAIEAAAGMLHHLGIGKGDRVTIFAHNGMDYLVSMFACWRIGAISALVNVKFADELDYYFADHTPSVVIYTHDMGEAVRRAAAKLTPLPRLVCMDGPQDGAESLPELMAAGFAPPPDPADETAIAHLSYTSGTTGRPKGACLAHEPTMRATSCIAERLRITAEDVSFGPTALSSSYQLVGNLLAPLRRGATVNVMGRWTAESGFEALERTQATLLVANPTLLTDVLEAARARGGPPKTLRLGMSGGGPVPPVLKRAWRDELGLPLVESYGQSELGGFVALGEPVLLPDEALGAVGRPLPDKDVRIQDAEGREVPPGELGEICLAGGFMVGYWGRPEKTAETLRGGFLHTGDAGTMAADGTVTMRGRFAELITVAGRTWFPRDIEEALAAEGGVREAAVVGLPDAALGERPVAFVTGEAGLDPAGLKAAIAPRLGYDLTPLAIRRIEAFPMTPTGKIAKAELRAAALAGA
ncbi:class I adenylate-forming enzyme family protein [Labrys wisconsinensis]|uniref:Acyl-CoA synthetase (AMP-forming)/AMP-acid ligase II n=1 Tax=Labrys wisconsinensis TaxID=425677 RepID=A0ABU0J1Q8_9HYPH|nr:class I adenylate-forming enzyme family protein [Labrys wisconsinensis]MDQ0468185.1 acyl-CoA synthetase (AMP-forming)/AMP-acid ligase II [Labrys wisconsinensis]